MPNDGPNTRKVERQYRRRLRAVARHIGDILVDSGVYEDFDRFDNLQQALEHYSRALDQWAGNVADTMLQNAEIADRKYWNQISSRMSRETRARINQADMRLYRDQLQREQIELITSLPTEASKRVYDITTDARAQGLRAADVAEDILKTGDVTKSRADLIARTEVARAGSTFTQGRAEQVGSTQYIWRTARDSDVRTGHRHMEGVVVDWAVLPAVRTGDRIYHHHAGRIFNCRCRPEPIIPD